MGKFFPRQAANIISLLRILGVSLIFWLTPYNNNLWQLYAVIIYTFVCLTDFVDGWIARKLNVVSDTGKILDPLADKILVLVFLPLLEMQVISSFPVFIILAREFAVMALRVLSAKEGYIMAAKLSGKIKTAITLPVCGILFGRVEVTEVANLPLLLVPLNELRRWVFAWPAWVFNLLIYLTVIVTIWSFFEYFENFIWQQYAKKTGGDKTKAKKFLITLVPNTFSLLNLICGSIAILCAWNQLYELVFAFIVVSFIADVLDGKIARKLNASTTLGAKLDSKADVISFGFAPAMVIFQLLAKSNNALHLPLYNIIGFLVAGFYFLCLYYRLRRFDKQGHSNFFSGLPSPVAAGMVLLASLSAFLSQPIIFSLITIILGVLMLSKIPYIHMDATRNTFLHLLKYPAYFLTILAFLKLIRIPYIALVFPFELLFFLTLVYLFSPLKIQSHL